MIYSIGTAFCGELSGFAVHFGRYVPMLFLFCSKNGDNFCVIFTTFFCANFMHFIDIVKIL